MAAVNDLDAEEQRLATLHREIAEAEATLRALHEAMQEAIDEATRQALSGVVAENQRLAAENRAALQETESAYAMLQEAVRTSRTDSLTGLLNRLALWDTLEHDVEFARRNGKVLAVLFLDVNHFKQVNDTFGHAVGDQLLQRIADTLVATVRASDTVCRMGGDEFVVIAPTATREDAAQLALKIQQELRRNFMLEGHVVASSTSVGFSVFPGDGRTADALMRKADEAMYRAKHQK
jgi:diguanylate cyclase (GGDEF)-like protein